MLSTSGGLGEAETGGVTLNVIPREGGNTFSGSFVANGAERLVAGEQLHAVAEGSGSEGAVRAEDLYEINPMGGGRIIRDKLWFYTSYRHIATDNTVPGMWVNKNAGNPNAWSVDFDQSKQAFSETLDRILTGRVTWQATPRNKINVQLAGADLSRNWKGGGTRDARRSKRPTVDG